MAECEDPDAWIEMNFPDAEQGGSSEHEEVEVEEYEEVEEEEEEEPNTADGEENNEEKENRALANEQSNQCVRQDGGQL